MHVSWKRLQSVWKEGWDVLPEVIIAASNPGLRLETWGTRSGAGTTADCSASLRNEKESAWDTELAGDELGDGTPFDKLREECGVMAVYNHPDAARLTYWGLYSLQHRGQESGGIASADGEQCFRHQGHGAGVGDLHR